MKPLLRVTNLRCQLGLARLEADTLSQEVLNILEYFNYKFGFLKTYSTDLEHFQSCPLKLNV